MSRRKPGEHLAFPILFQPDMLRATLDGRKTMTRRIAHTILDATPDELEAAFGRGPKRQSIRRADARPTTGQWVPDVSRGWGRVEVGDRLRVRETLRRTERDGWTYALDGAPVQLAANDPNVPAMYSWAHHKEGDVCVSIHMPMWACRRELIVTSKRFEHVQEISEADARAEGVSPAPDAGMRGAPESYSAAFALLWDRINGTRGPWASNPWVVVIGYELGEARRATG